jgi:hypothetical protein
VALALVVVVLPPLESPLLGGTAVNTAVVVEAAVVLPLVMLAAPEVMVVMETPF